MRRLIDEDAPTIDWAKPGRVHAETPLGGVELAALHSENSAAWDAQTVAVRLPVEREGPSRLLAMSIAAVLSFVLGLATFTLVMKLQAQSAADAQITMPAGPSLAAAPLVEEGVPIPSPMPGFDPAPSGMNIQFVPTADVMAPPDPRPSEAASPIVPYTSAASAPRAPHAAPAPTVRKGRKQGKQY